MEPFVMHYDYIALYFSQKERTVKYCPAQAAKAQNFTVLKKMY